MNFLRTVIDQLRNPWNQASLTGRIVFVATSLVCTALVVGVGIWSARPLYVPLATGLAPTTAADVVSALDAEGIDNRLNFSGSAVMVPKQQWNRARLLVGNQLGQTNNEVTGDFGDSLLGDPRMNEYRILRHREEMLGRSIARMVSVVSATVHIGRPQPTPFVRDQKPTTASVVLELQAGSPFTREQAVAIVAMIAGSVEGLEPDKVTVMDTRGQLLSANMSSSNAEIASQLEYRQRLETDLSAKAETMLAQMLGVGRGVVRVTADVDFTKRRTTEKFYDAESRVKRSETTTTKTRTLPAATAGGVAGTGSNLTNTPGAGQYNPIQEKDEVSETQYEPGLTVDDTTEAAGKIRRLTVAVMVDLTKRDDGQMDSTRVTKEQVEAIVKQAVGFDEQRNDQIEVLATQMAGTLMDDQDQLLVMRRWEFYRDLTRNSSLGLAAVVALMLGVLTIRKFRPVTVPSDVQASSPDRARILAELAAQARQHPEVIGRIIDAWLAESESRDAHDAEHDVDPEVVPPHLVRRAA